MPEIVFKSQHTASEGAVLLDWNLSRHLVLGQVVDLDLLLCTRFGLEHAILFRCSGPISEINE